MQERHENVLLAPPILSHIQLDFCWVCKAKGEQAKLHSHHVVPTAFGGRDGPQVTVCSNHHNNLHDAAKMLMRLKGNVAAVVEHYRSLQLSPAEYHRFLYLVTCVYKAELAASGSRNKTKGNMNRRTHDKLVAITRYLNVSQEKAIERAIDLLHANLFGE